MQSDVSELLWELEQLLLDRGWAKWQTIESSLDGRENAARAVLVITQGQSLIDWLKKAATTTIKRELQIHEENRTESEITAIAERVLNRSTRDRGASRLRCYSQFLQPWQIENLIKYLQQNEAKQ